MPQYPLVSEEIPQVLQDDTLIEKVRFFLEGQLKKSFHTNRGIDIVLGKDIHKVSEGINSVKQLDGTWQTVDVRHTIGMMDKLNGIPVPIPNTKLVIYTGSLSFFVNPNASEEKENYFELVKEALEEFTDELRGASFSDTAKGYKFATNAEEYNSNNLIEINGVEYVWYTATVYILSSTETYFGNDISYKMKSYDQDNEKFEEIYPVERVHARGTQINSNQTIEGSTAGQTIRQNVLSISFTFYWTFKEIGENSVLTNIVKWNVAQSQLPGAAPQNFPFTLETEWPAPIGKILDNLVITDGSVIPGIGDGIIINIILNPAKQGTLDAYPKEV